MHIPNNTRIGDLLFVGSKRNFEPRIYGLYQYCMYCYNNNLSYYIDSGWKP